MVARDTWGLYATLTYRHPPAQARADRQVRDWLRILLPLRPDLRAYVASGRQGRGALHHHILVNVDVGQRQCARIAKLWRAGNADVQVVRSALDVALYLREDRHDDFDLIVAQEL